MSDSSWTAAHQAPLSMGFSNQEYWSGMPSPSPSISLDVPKTGMSSYAKGEKNLPLNYIKREGEDKKQKKNKLMKQKFKAADPERFTIKHIVNSKHFSQKQNAYASRWNSYCTSA